VSDDELDLDDGDDDDGEEDVMGAIAELLHEAIEYLDKQSGKEAAKLQGKMEFALQHWFELNDDEDDEDEDELDDEPDDGDEEEDGASDSDDGEQDADEAA